MRYEIGFIWSCFYFENINFNDNKIYFNEFNSGQFLEVKNLKSQLRKNIFSFVKFHNLDLSNEMLNNTLYSHVTFYNVNLENSEFIVTTKNFYKKRTKFLIDAHKTNIPVYVIRKNTLNQIVSLLNTIKKQKIQSAQKSDPAIVEAENMAIEISNSNNISKHELSPQSSYIRKLQHSIAEKYGLNSVSKNQGKSRRVVYFKN